MLETLVDRLCASGRRKVFVLSRKACKPSSTGEPEVLVIDYDDVNGMARTLQAHNIDTVISALFIGGDTEQAQLNLIKAADMSLTTRRFIPSEFAGYVPSGESIEDEMRAPLLRAADALARTELIYTRVSIGMFMDYFGHPTVPSHLRPFPWAINVPDRCAAIPGTGEDRLSLTHSKDVAEFVECLIDESEWSEHSIVCGSDTTLNEIVGIAEKALGEKFQVSYDSINDLKLGKATVAFADGASYGGVDSEMTAAAVGLSVVEGQLALPKGNRLNQKFPNVHPMSIEELISKAWSKD